MEKRKQHNKRLKEIMSSTTGAVILSVAIWAAILLLMAITADASGPGYQYIEQTENEEVIALTEQVAEIYPICPELLQALIFYESGNQRTAVSRWGDIGYMQANPRWMRPWMDKLGVTDLMDGYSNILVGTDYLVELFQKYEDPVLVLMVYNQGPDKATKLYESGEISKYAGRILELAEQLERHHGK